MGNPPVSPPVPEEMPIDASHSTRGMTEEPTSLDINLPEPEQSGASDGDIAEASDDSSDRSQRLNHMAEEMGFLELQPETLALSQPSTSHATVPPVDIPRKPSARNSSRSASRTPSPYALPVETVTSEGPMTPRNDIGPFVFDGSAGRAAGTRLTATVLNAGGAPEGSSGIAQALAAPNPNSAS